jgi:hypothetical protein
MKKALSTLIIISFVCSPIAHADTPATSTATEEANQNTPPPAMEVVSPQSPYGGDLEDAYDDEDYESPVGTEVTTTESSAEKAKKKQFWRNIVIATAAVIVAVVSILVVSNNNGESP